LRAISYKIKMKKIFTLLLLGMFMISLASAEDNIGSFKPDNEFNITNYCSTADCTYMNLESITYPDGTVIFLGTSMDQIGQEFTYNFSSEELGKYYFRTCADPRGNEMCERDYFIINPTGSEFTIAQGILYGFLLILLGVFLYFSIYGVKNADSAEWLIGYICLSYVVLYLVISVIWILSANYLYTFPMLGNVLYVAWLVMAFGFLPFVIAVSLYIMGKAAEATLEQDYLKQGYSKEDARELSRKKKR